MPDSWEPPPAVSAILAQLREFSRSVGRFLARTIVVTEAVLVDFFAQTARLFRAAWNMVLDGGAQMRQRVVAGVLGMGEAAKRLTAPRPRAPKPPKPVRAPPITPIPEDGQPESWGLDRPRRRLGWLTTTLVGVGAFAAVSAGAAVALFYWVTSDMPSKDDIWRATESSSVTFLDRYGRVIARLDARGDLPVDMSELPKFVPEAIISIEDRRFYDHNGVDFEGLSRALVENFKEGKVVQGGSTITQQLAKNLFLNHERTLWRKVREAAWAVRLEMMFTKEEILRLYMSRVFFGAGAYGIEAASERFFHKPASDLQLEEAALLAGLLKAPSSLNPVNEPIKAEARKILVLNAMAEAGYISADLRDVAKATPVKIERRSNVGNWGYFKDWIEPELDRIIGDQRDDYIVETTLDIDAQHEAERVVMETIAAEGEAAKVSQAALLSIDSEGGVRAMVGGRQYGESYFNRATQARRQPGSSFKYFIYLTAMQQPEFSPWTVRVDRPIVIGDWAPGNYKDKYFGPVQLASAFARSLNMVAIEICNEVGGDKVIANAERLGVRTKLYNYRSLALGAQELTLLEMTGAFAAMTTEGYPVQPHGIRRVRNADGKVIYAWQTPKADRVIDERALRSMNYLLNRVVESGTGTRAKLPGWEVGGKTGTGNDYRDAWFVGFTSGVTTGVWAGNDHFAETNRVTGGSIPAQIWAAFMPTALRNEKPTPMLMPDPADYAPEPDPDSLLDPNAAAPPVAPRPVGAPLFAGTPPVADEAPPPGSLDGPEG